jgi:hypothetical protein
VPFGPDVDEKGSNATTTTPLSSNEQTRPLISHAGGVTRKETKQMLHMHH